ncbi:MAG: hypothetical protein U1F43_18630 [Myxococcota bacterium]
MAAAPCGAAAAPPHPVRPTPRRPADEGPDDRRRAQEPSPPGPTLPLDEEEKPLRLMLLGDNSRCDTVGWARVRERLLALENRSSLMSLEVWGDREVYHPGDHVSFFMRSPRGAYVTLWWIGPEGHTVIAMENARIPAERNVLVDTGGVVVPPLGREQWVAIATLEPIPLGCRSEAAMLQNIERRLAIEHGVAHWDVISRMP